MTPISSTWSEGNKYLSNGLEMMGFPGGAVVKNLPMQEMDAGLIPGSGRSPGEGNGNPLKYSCLGNPMHSWWTIVHGVTKSQTTEHACALEMTLFQSKSEAIYKPFPLSKGKERRQSVAGRSWYSAAACLECTCWTRRWSDIWIRQKYVIANWNRNNMSY